MNSDVRGLHTYNVRAEGIQKELQLQWNVTINGNLIYVLSFLVEKGRSHITLKSEIAELIGVHLCYLRTLHRRVLAVLISQSMSGRSWMSTTSSRKISGFHPHQETQRFLDE